MTHHVLIIDDEDFDRRIAKRAIQKTWLDGAYIYESPTYEHGLMMVGEVIFDIIICDYELGDGTGLEVLEKLREYESRRVGKTTIFVLHSGSLTNLKNNSPEVLTEIQDLGGILVDKNKDEALLAVLRKIKGGKNYDQPA